ncbi:hypothetical protein KCU93_g265, partial [Aureobasidium melanogenum]
MKLSFARNVPQIYTPTSKETEKPHSKFSEFAEWLETTWYIEIFFLLCSAVCATLIVTFLAIHNNTPIDSWTIYFSINTVVSTLGVVFKSTLFIAVSAALAQGKWTWFRKRNSPLSTFEAIDAASRDTLESFKLLWRMRGQHLVSAGALVIAFGFMVDPFLQAIISDYGLLVDIDASIHNSTKATIGKSNRFDGGTQCITTFSSRYPKIDTTPDFAVAAALYDGLNAAISHGYQNVTFTCSSGNCTWTEYTSLAVRSTCFDISSLLKKTTLGDVVYDTTSTTQTSSSKNLESMTSSIDPSSYSVEASTYLAPSSTFPSSIDPSSDSVEASIYLAASSTFPDSSDSSTLSSDAITSTNPPQTSLETEPPGYSAPPSVTVLSAFDASVQSTATRATTGLEKRESSDVEPSSTPTQSSATWASWTLEHLNLTLSNTDRASRNDKTFAVLQAEVVADPSLTINFVASQALLAAFTIIRTDNTYSLGSAAWDAADASAMECGLELTLNVYNSSVRNNVLMEQIVASASERVPGSWLPSPNIDQRGIHPNNLSVDSGKPEWNPIYHSTFMYRDDYALDPGALKTNVKENFNVSQRSLVSTLDFLTSLIRQDHDNATVKAVVQVDQPPFYTYGSAILQPLLNQTNTTATFDAIARSMSNAIRNVGNESVSGTAQQWVRYYQVRWAFLALPLTLFTIGSIFFALSILDAHRSGVPSWKANNTATMLHGPDELLHRDLRDKNHNRSLGVASETMARLECFPEGFALVAADSPVARISRPTTPARDEEEHEMSNLKIPTTPQTPGSNITLVNSPSVGEASEQATIRSVSPIHNGPGWSDIQLDDLSTPLGVRRIVQLSIERAVGPISVVSINGELGNDLEKVIFHLARGAGQESMAYITHGVQEIRVLVRWGSEAIPLRMILRETVTTEDTAISIAAICDSGSSPSLGPRYVVRPAEDRRWLKRELGVSLVLAHLRTASV